jgi:hypothetical protein
MIGWYSSLGHRESKRSESSKPRTPLERLVVKRMELEGQVTIECDPVHIRDNSQSTTEGKAS